MKIVFTDVNTVSKNDIDLSIFNEYGEVFMYSDTSEYNLKERIKDANAVICNKTVLDKDIISSAKKLEYIGLFATGFNNIDLDAASERGITVCNAGSYSTNAVAQHVFAYILNHYCQLDKYSEYTKSGKWMESSTFSGFSFPTYELAGKNLGLIGFGNIAKKTAKIAESFDMNVYVNNRTVYENTNYSFVDFEELLLVSDIISVHVPLNEDTNRMFNKEAFNKMRSNALFINTARGGIVDEQALREALEKKQIAAAAIDVLTIEPMTNDCVLYDVDNLIITPHTAWAPIETRTRLVQIVSDNLKNYLNKTPTNVVNKISKGK